MQAPSQAVAGTLKGIPPVATEATQCRRLQLQIFLTI